MGQDIEEMLETFKSAVGEGVNTGPLKDFMGMAQGSAFMCKIPNVLTDHTDAVRMGYLIGEGLQHLQRPNDRAVQQDPC